IYSNPLKYIIYENFYISIIQVNTITLIHVAHSGKLFLTIKCFTHFLPQSINSAKQHLSVGESGGGLVTLRRRKSAL
ncbi:MAG: hypothetical protein WAX60_07610, partial [Blautia wexlerae]